MELFETVHQSGHEQIVFCHDAGSGLRAIIAIHDTTLGPALGGLRMWPYESEESALNDALRLSRGMTYKAAVSGLNLGGGKSVIIADPHKDKSEALFRSFGRFVETLQGRYITAEDVGIDVADMEYVLQETDHVVGIPESLGGSGDPSPFTAFGTLQGIRACLRQCFDDETLSHYSFAIQGVGHVGYHLARLLREQDAKVFVTDIHRDNLDRCVNELGCEAVEPEEIYDVDADVFAPSALGAVLNEDTVPRMHFRIVCGSANNQLAHEGIGDELHRRGILYAPDYAVNAGGLMNVYLELEGYNPDKANHMVKGIYQNILNILRKAHAEGLPTYKAADLLAEQRIEQMRRLRPARTGSHRRHRLDSHRLNSRH